MGDILPASEQPFTAAAAIGVILLCADIYYQRTGKKTLSKDSFARIIHGYQSEDVIVSTLGEDQANTLSGMPGYHRHSLFCMEQVQTAIYLRTGMGESVRVIFQLP